MIQCRLINEKLALVFNACQQNRTRYPVVTGDVKLSTLHCAIRIPFLKLTIKQ